MLTLKSGPPHTNFQKTIEFFCAYDWLAGSELIYAAISCVFHNLETPDRALHFPFLAEEIITAYLSRSTGKLRKGIASGVTALLSTLQPFLVTAS